MANLPDLRTNTVRETGLKTIPYRNTLQAQQSRRINQMIVTAENWLNNPTEANYAASRKAAAPINQIPKDRYALFAVALRDALQDAEENPTPENLEAVEILQSAVSEMLWEVFAKC